MSSFTKPLEYQPTMNERQGRRIYRLTAPFVYVLGFIGSGVKIDVPVYFETDFASIPAFADDWFGLDPTDAIVKKAAVIHDYLYVNHGELDRVYAETESLLNRKLGISKRHFADRVFFEAMGVLRPKTRLGRLKRYFSKRIIYLAVRIFGGKNFDPKPLSI